VKPVVVYLLVLLGLPTWATGQNFHFEKLTEFHGLSDNRVTCFMKDNEGYMWIGTENGLNRYDGFTFEIYRPGQSQHNLSHEQINDIEQDANGHLWVATWSGLNVLDPKTDSLFVFLPDDDAYRQKKTRIASSITWDVHIDNAHRVWLALDTRDLCYFDPTTKEFTYFPWREYVSQTFPAYAQFYKSIQKIKQKSADEIWLGTTLGLFSFTISTKTFHYQGGEAPVDFISMQYDSLEQRVYFGQRNLFMYDVQHQQLHNLTSQTKISATKPGKQQLIASLNGLWSVDSRSLNAKKLSQPEETTFTLHHESVNTIFVDRDIVWIGSPAGVTIHDSNLNIFPFVRVFNDSVKAEVGNVYYILDHAGDNCYYITSYTQHKLIVINKSTGARKEISSIQGKPLKQCTRIVEDSQHRLWLLTSQSIFVSDPQHQNFRLFHFPRDNYEYRFVDVAEDEEGNFWFAALSKGVYFYNTRENTWRLLQEVPDGLFAARPTALLSDRINHTLWVADFSFGAFHYDFKTRAVSYHGMDTQDPRTMQSSLSNALTIDHDGNVWIATTSGGVSRYTSSKKEFTTYTMKNGLPENTIDAIQADLHGNLWLASNKGLTHLKPTGEIIRHYHKNNGLPFSNFSTPFSSNNKHELLIGLPRGFLKFHPDSLKITSVDFPIVLTEAHQGDSALNTAQSHRFAFNQNDFTFQFSALTYSLPHEVTYYYQLEGYDRDWITAGNQHIARYTNLGPGEYTFRVKATDYSGKPSSNIGVFSFSISPPFWMQWWFMALIALLGITSIYVWIRNLQLKIQSQKILNQVATSLYGQNTIEGIFWTLARNCIDYLHFQDCVVYLLIEEQQVLIQKSAAGPKSIDAFQIHNPIEIKVGSGIVGTVAQTGKAEIIANTANDPRYIVDDSHRLSEIAVPIVVDGKVFGVIDSEHPRKNFYTRWHLHMLKEIAAICSAKLGRYFAEEQIRSKVARDLHDDMGSTLSSIKIMSNIALEKQDQVTVLNYLKSIRQNTMAMQESMSDMVWAINPENDTLEKVIVRMKQFAAEILEPLDIQYEFFEDGDFQRARMNLNTRKDFFLIFKEAINNAAKYSRGKKITIELKRYANGVLMRLRDDGCGFDSRSVNTGNGLKNMRHRAQNIKATLHVESIPGQGTTIQVVTPIT